VSIDVGPGTDAAQLIERTGNRFEPVSCPSVPGQASGGVCTTSLHLMPSSRAEVWVTYRDAAGIVQPPPGAVGAVLRTSGFWAGPTGDNWPAVDLAKVQFVPGNGAARALEVTGQTSLLTSPQRISADLKRANSAVPSDPNCNAIAPTHKRRIFFGATPDDRHAPGLGYEEIDAQGQPLPGTFQDIATFDPANPTVCLPLGSGDAPVTERWELVNLMSMDHNFHVHQAHFSVLSEAEIAGTAAPDQLHGAPVLMDSLPLVHADGTCNSVADWRQGSCTAHPATVEIQFGIAGDFVYHCHILSHEDAGMMAVIRVRSAQAAEGAGMLERVFSAIGFAEPVPAQPSVPRIGGAFCRAPRSAGISIVPH
jgi:plastocyanin